MEVQLKELIETIKKDGIAAAEAKAAEILKEAEMQAASLRQKAQAEVEKMLSDAKREIARTEQASQDALIQAGRDLLLSLERRIVKLFETVIQASTAEVLNGENLVRILTALVTAWVEKNSPNIEILLSSKDYQALETGLRSKLAKEMQKGVVIKPSHAVDAGFRIGEKNGSVYYDFSLEGLAEILSASLNSRLGEIVKKASKIEG